MFYAEYESPDDDAPDMDDIQKAAFVLFDEPSINELQHEMDDSFWYTVFTLLTDMWSIALGFILVECVVYEAINDYVNLLVKWQEFRHESAILNNAWLMVLFGLGVAVCTCLLEGIFFLFILCRLYFFIFFLHSLIENCIQCIHHKTCE